MLGNFVLILFTDLNATFAVNDDYKFKFLPVRGTIIAETGLKCSALQLHSWASLT